MFDENEYKLTYDEVKQHDGFSDITEEEAEELIDFLWQYSVIVYNTINK